MSLRLLLVDDVPEQRAELAEALVGRGNFTVVGEAGDGAGAVSLAEDHQPDLIVLDLGIPDLAGQEVLKGLRAAAPDALVVVYSGSHTVDHAALGDSVEAIVESTHDVEYLADLLDEIGNRIARVATMRLDPDPRQVSLARRFVMDHCVGWERSSLAYDAAVVVSELVSNALVHLRSPCELTVGLRGDVLRIDVVDHGGGMPDLRDVAADEEHGRGLLLVSILSTAWGSEPRDDGKSVWAELHAQSLRADAAASGDGTAGGTSRQSPAGALPPQSR